MVEHDVIHVAVAPPANLEANLVKNVAVVIDKSPYDVRLLLAGNIPKIIAHYDSMPMAESRVQNLRELGLAAISCHDSQLRQSPPNFRVKNIELGVGEAVFQDSTHHEKRIAANDVFLLLEGNMQTAIEVETTKSVVKLNLATTLLTGGIPVFSRVDEKTKGQSVQEQHFVRLYDREPSHPGIEIIQDELNYSFLGAKIALSSSLNFTSVLAKLRESFPQAIFDNRLLRYSGGITSAEDFEINCKLIYLFHLAKSSPGPAASSSRLP